MLGSQPRGHPATLGGPCGRGQGQGSWRGPCDAVGGASCSPSVKCGLCQRHLGSGLFADFKLGAWHVGNAN